MVVAENKEKFAFTHEQEMYICDNYYHKTSTILSKEFNCNVSKITNTWIKHGLKNKTKRIYQFAEDYFETINTVDKAYFLGFIAADGCVYDNKNSNKQNIIRIALHKKDVDILEKFQKYLNTEMPIHRRHGRYVSLELASDKMFTDLNSVCIFPNKTYGQLQIKVNDNYIRHFIRGYFDGDGSISTKTDSLCDVGISFSGYENNLNVIKNHLRDKNIYSSFAKDNRTSPRCDLGYFGSLCFTNKTNKYAFLKYIYEDNEGIYMDRKYLLSQQFIQKIETSTRILHLEAVNYYKYVVCN